jgi:hypothetical protein
MEQNMSYPDVIPPPPAPENIMQPPNQMPDFITLPMQAVKILASGYSKFGWALQPILKMSGYKMPPEVDHALRAIAGDNPEGAQDLQRMATGGTPDPYNIRPVEIPAPRIGERVLTQDIAQKAWELHYQHHWTFRQIAEYLTEEGYPVSHTTVSNYISEIDEDIAEEQHSRGARLKRAFLIGTLIVGPSLATFLIVHFLRF